MSRFLTAFCAGLFVGILFALLGASFLAILVAAMLVGGMISACQ